MTHLFLLFLVWKAAVIFHQLDMNGVLSVLLEVSIVEHVNLLIVHVTLLVHAVQFRDLVLRTRSVGELVDIFHVLSVLNTDLVKLRHGLKWVQSILVGLIPSFLGLNLLCKFRSRNLGWHFVESLLLIDLLDNVAQISLFIKLDRISKLTASFVSFVSHLIHGIDVIYSNDPRFGIKRHHVVYTHIIALLWFQSFLQVWVATILLTEAKWPILIKWITGNFLGADAFLPRFLWLLSIIEGLVQFGAVNFWKLVCNYLWL